MLTPPSPTALRALLYLRVSRDRFAQLRKRGRADDRGSISQQEKDGLGAIADQGWEFAGMEVDPEVSVSIYSKREREGWPRFLDRVRRREGDVVVLREASRADRKLTDGSAFLDLVRDLGVLVYIMERERLYDPRKHADWEDLADQFLAAAKESNKNSARIGAAKRHMRRNGMPDSRPPWGYSRVYDPDTGDLVGQEPNQHAESVVELFRRFVDGGQSIRELTQTMERDYPQRRWQRSNVRDMLRNPRYVGKIPDGSKLYDAQWPALESGEKRTFEALWEAAQTKLDDPARKTTRPGAVRHLLSYWVTAHCGSVMQWTHGKRRHAVYQCAGDKCSTIRADWLDDYIAALVVARLADPVVRDLIAQSRDHADGRLADLQSRRRGLQRQVTDAFAAWEAGTLSAELLGMAEQSISPKLATIDAEIRELQHPPVLRPLLETDGLASAEAAWHRLTQEGRIAMQREIVQNVLAYVTITPASTTKPRTLERSRVDYDWI